MHDNQEQYSGPGGLYCKLAHTFYEYFGYSEEQYKEKKEKEKEKLKDLRKRFQNKKAELKKIKNTHGENTNRWKKAKKEFEKRKKKYNKTKAKVEQEDFYDAVNFLGLDLRVEEVLIFSGVSAVMIFFSLLAITFVSFFQLSNNIFRISLVSTVVLPLASFLLLSHYPEILANRRKVKTLAKIPEAVTFLTISMQLTPSLEKAIDFSAKNSEEPVSSGLRKILWDVYLRKYPSVENSLVNFAQKWGKWNEDFKMALYAVRESVLENSHEGLERSLDRANRIVIKGTKTKVEKFASSLSTPSMVLFALGILLPIIIGAMLPMLSMSSITSLTSSMSSIKEGSMETVNNQKSNTVLIVLLMDIIFPLAAFCYSYHILGKRPGTTKPPSIPSTLTKKKRIILTMTSVTIGVSLVITGIFLLYSIGGDNITRTAYAMPILWGISVPISLVFFVDTRERKKRREEILELEDQLPDALFQLGSQMVQGKSLEKSFENIADSMGETKVGKFFRKVVSKLQVQGKSLEDVFTNEDGILENFPSNKVKGSMKAVFRASQKNPKDAGKNIIEISSYQKDMQNLEQDIKNDLSSTVDTMKATGTIFAPLVMGVTTALYILLSDVIGKINSGGADMISAPIFTLIIGIYLIEILIIINYFTAGINYGSDTIERRYSIALTLPIGLAVFTLCTLFSQSFMGVV